jgi:hypothetical protein
MRRIPKRRAASLPGQIRARVKVRSLSGLVSKAVRVASPRGLKRAMARARSLNGPISGKARKVVSACALSLMFR